MPYLVTLASGVSNVALPNGQIAQAGQAAFLTDEQYVRLSPGALISLFSSIATVTTVTGSAPAVTVGPQTPVMNYNPYAEGDNEPSASQTYLNTPYVYQGP